MYLNNQYFKEGEIDLEKLFIKSYETAKVNKLKEDSYYEWLGIINSGWYSLLFLDNSIKVVIPKKIVIVNFF